MGKIYIGTSGWSYEKDWGDIFYPKEIPKKDHLNYISTVFNTVEINNTFYNLPYKKTFKKWQNATVDDFVFSVKLSRYITHRRRIKNSKTPMRKFLERASGLGGKLGPVLVQFPPTFPARQQRLDKFLKDARDINNGIKLAVEFRHKSWLDKETLRLLKRNNAALVFSHSDRFPYPEEEPVTSDFIYIRFHGPKELYASEYGTRRLKAWASKIKNWAEGGSDIYAYFDNDVHGYAPQDAKKLKDMVGEL